ncbi:MAG: ribosome biogenesis GTPase Der, partial [Leptospira sp.]|nr:ribosome biogenesis GTPase Der [Leptospira sp.]
IYCINKSDSVDDDFDLENYFRLGLQEVIPVSALGRRNVKLLIEKINFYLPQGLEETETISDFRISIVGKPNSGKSSLLNAILGFTRSIVSNIPGTTRDSVNSIAKYKDKNIEIIDTAGIRKASKTGDSIEFYSYSRTLKSIESSDIVVLIIDATKGIGEFDKKIFGHIREKGKPIVFAVNKWDLVPEKDSKSFDEYKKDMIDRFFPVQSFPVISISAKENQRVRKVLDECIRLFEKSRTKVPTSDLNGRLREWMDEGKFNSQAKKSPKLLYATQISTSPFKVLFFVNDVSIFKPSMLAYLKKKLVDSYELEGMQIDIELRSDREKHRERKKK